MAVSLAGKLTELSAFSNLSEDENQAIASLGRLVRLNPSETLCEQGDVPQGLYLVMSGAINLVRDAKSATPVTVDVLHDGAFFASHSLFEIAALPYRAQAGSEHVVCKLIERTTFVEFLKNNPDIGQKVVKSRQISSLVSFLETCPSLAGLPHEALESLALHAETKTVDVGEQLIKQGEREDHIYIVRDGRFAVTRDEALSSRISVLSRGDVIGEIAVLSGEVRNANVIADEKGKVYEIPGQVIRDAVHSHEALQHNLENLMRVRVEKIDKREDKRKHREAEHQRKEAERQKRLAEQQARKQAEEAELVQTHSFWQTVRKKFFKPKPPAVRQHSQMDCSAACLCTVCETYGKRLSINVVREVARVRQDGASMSNIVRAAQEFGFVAEPFVSTTEQLRERKLPAIANWKGYHWVVVHEVTDTHVVIADPAQGLETKTIEEFEEGWSRYTIFLTPTQKFEELEESKPTLMSFWHFFEPYKRVIGEIFIAAIFLQILGVAVPLFTKFVVDDVILKGDTQWLLSALVLMAGIAFVSMAMEFIRDTMILRLSIRCNINMLTAVYDRMLRLPLEFFENRRTGDITNRLEQHEEISDFITEDGLETFLSLMTAVVYLCFMIYFNATLTVAAIGFMGFNFFSIRYISPRIRQVNKEAFVKEAEQESHLIESIQGAETLKTIGADFMARWKYENNFASVANLEFKTAKLSQLAGLIGGTLDTLGDIAILFLGGAYVIWGDMSVGELIAFTVFANGVQGPIMAVIGKWDELQEVYVAIERLNDVLEKEPEFENDSKAQADKVSLPGLRGEIEFRNVGFRYEPDDPSNVVQNVDLKVEVGQKVALVGASGCGKSTLIKLLYGFYMPSDGQILVDGFDIKDVWLPSLRQKIAMVPQKNMIFKGTVRDNIAMSYPDANIEDVREAATLAGAHEFIAKMPAGYETELDEQGSNLSGGQRQRLAIARAFLQPASMLVLDEATSALDNETERVVMENIKTHFSDKTVFIIAHRLSTIRNADLIVVLNNGLVVESGSHDQLIAQNGFYYHLASSQKSVG